jgi:hypothetical protein
MHFTSDRLATERNECVDSEPAGGAQGGWEAAQVNDASGGDQSDRDDAAPSPDLQASYEEFIRQHIKRLTRFVSHIAADRGKGEDAGRI